MELGAFSVSLNVADIKKSYEFYRKLGFSHFGGNLEDGWLILKNGIVVIGLFEKMISANCLTFSPGWDQDAKALDNFVDVREIQKKLRDEGIAIKSEVAADTTGPGSFTIVDPDGNVILFDQYV